MKKYFLIPILIGLLAGAAYLLSYTAAPTETTFGGVSLRLDYATTAAEREVGLGGRTTIAEDYGMLFVFPRDERYGFWMKDTLVPLDMFWLDDKGQVVYIAANVATTTYPNVFYPPVPARYVLETPAGFAERHHTEKGGALVLPKWPKVSE